MAHSKHDLIRQWYGYCCGYCGVSEADSGGELTADHYRPVSQGGDDSDANLVYCCFRCNLNKGDFFPTPDDIAQGYRLLHPLRDDLRVHLREDADGTMSGLSAAGRRAFFQSGPDVTGE